MLISTYVQQLTPTMVQALSARPTRIALAWAFPSSLAPYPDIEEDLDVLPCAELNLADAKLLSPASLGLACKSFWRENGLQPISVKIPHKPTPAEKLQVRRLQLHDLLHVLLGFDVSPAGQLGVFSFVAAQHYCPQFERAARVFAHLYVTMAPWARGELADAEYRGRQLALNTPRLLTMPIEQEWNTSLVELRDRLNIRKARKLRSILETPLPSANIAQFATRESRAQQQQAPPVT